MIDRIIPKFLSSDQDERLTAEGMMTDALNVTITNMGEGTEGVLKNMKGTQAINASSDGDAIGSDTAVVIGQVTDDALGRIYVFVASDNNNNSGIYYVDTEDAADIDNVSYKVVMRSALFNFTKDLFVKADIVKGTFLSSADEHTIIYFTDGVNPPRKINVNRALNGAYNTGNADRFDRLVSTIKGSSNKAPTFSMGTDSDREINNINDNLFQFATQVVYNDGEESAVSPYSGVAVSRPTYLNALEGYGFGVMPYVDNTITINHNIDLGNIPDIAKIRILCRASNNASWFIADEYDPAEGVSAQLDGTGTATVLAAPNSNSYLFYADTLGSLVSPTVTAKQYDNVPLKAKGQAVVRDRLIYSNYTEGFRNVDCSGAGLSVAYSDISSSFVEYIDNAEVDSVIEATAATFTNIVIDFSQAADITGTAMDIPGGTRAVTEFKYRPNFSVSGEDLFTARIIYDEQGETEQTGVVTYNNITFANGTYPADERLIRIVSTQSQDGTAQELVNLIASEFQDLYIDFEYDGGESEWQSSTNNDPSLQSPPSKWTARIAFDDYTVAGLTITVRPYLSDLTLESTDPRYVIDQTEFLPVSNQYSDLDYEDTDQPISEEDASWSTLILNNTLKSGSSHSFGIVYYDKFGRHGFVNKIGSVDALYPSKRGLVSGETEVRAGTATASILFTERVGLTLENLITLPTWADSWQVVYGEPNTIFDSFQYTTGGAFVPVNDDGTVDTDSQKVYVSLKTLDAYRSDKGVDRDYSFTEGDKLRVIKYWDNYASPDDDWKYPTSNYGISFGGDGSSYDINNPIIEFDVVGVEFLSGDDAASNPLMGTTGGATYTNEEKKKYDGQFLVLESTQINTGVEITLGGTLYPISYWGFDWQNVAKKQADDNGESVTIRYNDDIDDASGTELINGRSFWHKRCLVDIVTPRKRTSEQIYYEVGVGGDCFPERNGTTYPNHGVIFQNVNQTNHYLRPVACKTPKLNGDNWNWQSPDAWEYQTMYIEDESVTDRIVSNSWNRGKAHAIYEKAKEVERPYSVTWSDKYNVDVETLTLSSFNASQANYANYANKYGSINYIANYDEMLISLQENKASIVPISKATLNQAAGGDGVVSLSTSVLDEGTINYYAGDWGCTSNPESVLIYDTQIFFADSSRGKIVRITREGLSPISDKGLQSLFAEKFRQYIYSSGTTVTKKVLSGYDPDDNYYYVTIKSDDGQNTYAYDTRAGVWVSAASFIPDMYSRMNDTMYSFKYNGTGEEPLFAWSHTSNIYRNRYYNQSYDTRITVVSKYNPSMVKIYKAIGLNGTRAHDTRIVSSIGNDTGNGVMPDTSYVEREDHFYREIPGDTSDTDSQNVFGVGTATAGGGTATITMNSKLRGMQIPIGGSLYYYDGALQGAGTGGAVPTIVSVDVENNTITLSSAFAAGNIGEDLFISTSSSANGARIRGHYAEITLENDTINRWELYSIDLNFENSRPNYALGQ